MFCEDVWIRYTDKHGKAYVSYHRTWDKARLLASKSMQALKEGGTAEQTTRPPRRPS